MGRIKTLVTCSTARISPSTSVVKSSPNLANFWCRPHIMITIRSLTRASSSGLLVSPLKAQVVRSTSVLASSGPGHVNSRGCVFADGAFVSRSRISNNSPKGLHISHISKGIGAARSSSTKSMAELVSHYSSKPQTPVSLQTLMETGRGER